MNENEKNSVVTENTTTKNPEIETPPAENAVQEPETQTTENSVPTEGEGEAPATNNTVANADEGTTAPTENTAPTTEGEPAGAQEFTLTIMQLTDEVSSILAEQKTPSKWDPEYMVPRYWMNDIQDNEVIVMDYSTYKLMGIPYSMNGDNVVLDFENAKRKKVSYMDWDEGEVLSGITAAFTEMNTKMTELTKEFQSATAVVNEMKPKLEAYQQAEAEAIAAADKAKRDELFAIMDEKLGANAEYAALKENKEISYADLETKCYALVGRQSAEFSYVPNKNNKGTVRFGVGGTQNGSDNSVYGGLMKHYLGK